MNKKIIATVGACALCVGLGVAGTLAWLTATSDTVTNTFTTSDINITLTESNVNDDDSPNTNSYQMIPGFTITKDPKVTVIAGSEDCYLFVKLEKSTNYDDYLNDYVIANGWTQLKNGNSDVDGVFYREVASNEQDQPFYVLNNNQLTVKGSVTKGDMDAIDDPLNPASEPTLTVTAFASQLYKSNTAENPEDNKFTPLEAWENISNPNGSNQ